MDYTRYFKRGGWTALGRYYATHPGKLKELLAKARRYASKEGLAAVREELTLVCQYVRDVFTRRYDGYNVLNLVVIVGAIAYVVAPVDALPDFLPVAGLVDDAAVLAWAASEFADELDRYRQHLAATPGTKSGGKPAAEGEEDIEDAEFEEIPPLRLEEKKNA